MFEGSSGDGGRGSLGNHSNAVVLRRVADVDGSNRVHRDPRRPAEDGRRRRPAVASEAVGPGPGYRVNGPGGGRDRPDSVVAIVRDPQVAVRVDVEAGRRVEFRQRGRPAIAAEAVIPVTGDGGDDARRRCDDPDAILRIGGEVQVAGRVQHQGRHVADDRLRRGGSVADVAPGNAGAARHRRDDARRAHLADGRIVAVGKVEVPRASNTRAYGALSCGSGRGAAVAAIPATPVPATVETIPVIASILRIRLLSPSETYRVPNGSKASPRPRATDVAVAARPSPVEARYASARDRRDDRRLAVDPADAVVA
ncbi:MAG: hypothetical protein MZV64_42940 [Ignavibacteriales bacterium]|nr:hypothetical protein [Ignavibacteriales bacterium]